MSPNPQSSIANPQSADGGASVPASRSPSQPSTLNSQLPFTPSPTESHKAFETFLCYFDIGQNRSFAKVARLTGVNLNSVKMWAHRFNWRERVRAYNTELLRARLAVETDARRNQAELRAQRALHFQDAEWKAAEKLLRAAQNALDVLIQTTPEKLSLSDVARALEIASKLGRLATGLATEQIAHAGELNVNLQFEIESAIKKVYGPVVDCPSLAGVGEGVRRTDEGRGAETKSGGEGDSAAPGEGCGEETDPVGRVTLCAPSPSPLRLDRGEGQGEVSTPTPVAASRPPCSRTVAAGESAELPAPGVGVQASACSPSAVSSSVGRAVPCAPSPNPQS